MIRSFTRADLARIAHLQPEGWQDLVPFFRFYLKAPFCRALKVESGGRIRSLGALITLGSTAWLAHIITEAASRRQGLGGEMTARLLRQADELGCPTQLLIATAQGEPLYRKFGFVQSHVYRFYARPEPREPVAPPGLRPLTAADGPAVRELDRRASGENRAVLLDGALRGGWAYEDRGELSGCYLPGLGEGTILAAGAEAGTALLERRLAGNANAPVVAESNPAACEYLERRGLVLTKTAARMVRNGPDPLRADRVFNRVGGHLG